MTDPCFDENDVLAYLEGGLPAPTRARLARHIERCAECRQLISLLARTSLVDGATILSPDDVISLDRSRPSSGDGATPPDPVRPGDTIDQFQIIRLLGRGGMGTVFLARDTLLGRKVALKLINASRLDSQEAVERFIFEAQATARFSHPNIVGIHGAGEHAGLPYLTLEYLEGQTLLQRLHEGPASPDEAAQIGLAVATALREAHSRGILHRDLKPSNILIPRDGCVRVLDFGLAKALKVEAAAAAIALDETVPAAWVEASIGDADRNPCGTPAYLAPEQWRGEAATMAADVWALGLILQELVSGQHPYSGYTHGELSTQIASDDPVPALARTTELPRDFATLVRRCVAKDPDARPPAAEVVERLEQLLERERAVSLPQPEQRPSREPAPVADVGADGVAPRRAGERRGPRRVWIVAAALALVGAIAALLVAVYWSPRPGGEALHFGLVPTYPSRVTRQDLRPFVRYLERRLDRPVEIVVARDYRALGQMLRKDEVQLAVLPPLAFVQTRRKEPGIVALASQIFEGAHTYQGLLVVHADSQIVRPAQLKGKRICYVDPNSTSGYLLPRGYLRSLKIDPDRHLGGRRFSGNHINVLRDVLARRCHVGAVFSSALLNARGVGLPTTTLHTLAVTGKAPNGVACAGPALPREQAARVRKALIELKPGRDLKRSVLGEFYRISGFAPLSDMSAFDVIERAAQVEGLLDAR